MTPKSQTQYQHLGARIDASSDQRLGYVSVHVESEALVATPVALSGSSSSLRALRVSA